MPFCAKCGASVDANADFCQNCGAPMKASSGPTPPPSYLNQPSYGVQSPMSRPTGVTILAVLAGLAALFSFIGAAIVPALLSFAGASGAGAFALLGEGYLIVVGLIALGVAYGFWVGAKWGWWLGIILSVLQIISIVVLDFISFIIGIIILYYLTRPHVKHWFHEA